MAAAEDSTSVENAMKVLVPIINKLRDAFVVVGIFDTEFL
jgi:hypothetical protein